MNLNDIVLTGYAQNSGKIMNIPISKILDECKPSTTENTSILPSSGSNSTLFIDTDTYAYSTRNIPNGKIKTLLFMIGLPENFGPTFKGRVYMLTITLRIFKSDLSTTIPPPNDVINPVIGEHTIQYVFDTTWTDRLKPNNFIQVLPTIYYSANNLIANLDILYDIIFDTKDNNLVLVIRTQSNEYYVIASSVVINSVYPKIVSQGDFVVDSKSLILNNTGQPLTNTQIASIAAFTQRSLYG